MVLSTHSADLLVVFDTDSWEESTLVSHARSGAKMARVSGCLHVIGGGAYNAHGGAEWFDPSQGCGRLFQT